MGVKLSGDGMPTGGEGVKLSGDGMPTGGEGVEYLENFDDVIYGRPPTCLRECELGRGTLCVGAMV